jgi:hypothetical protein
MGDKEKPKSEVEEVLAELEFENAPTTPKVRLEDIRRRGDPTAYAPRKMRRCKHCDAMILEKDNTDLVRHEGPCGMLCLGGGVTVGLPFHSDRCSHPRCERLTVPIPGIPRKPRRR